MGLCRLGCDGCQSCEGPHNHQRNVILLFAAAAELLDRRNHSLEQWARRR